MRSFAPAEKDSGVGVGEVLHPQRLQRVEGRGEHGPGALGVAAVEPERAHPLQLRFAPGALEGPFASAGEAQAGDGLPAQHRAQVRHVSAEEADGLDEAAGVLGHAVDAGVEGLRTFAKERGEPVVLGLHRGQARELLPGGLRVEAERDVLPSGIAPLHQPVGADQPRGVVFGRRGDRVEVVLPGEVHG